MHAINLEVQMGQKGTCDRELVLGMRKGVLVVDKGVGATYYKTVVKNGNEM